MACSSDRESGKGRWRLKLEKPSWSPVGYSPSVPGTFFSHLYFSQYLQCSNLFTCLYLPFWALWDRQGPCLPRISVPGPRQAQGQCSVVICKGPRLASCCRPFSVSRFLGIKSRLLSVAYEAPCVCLLIYSQGSDLSLVGNGGNCVRVHRNDVIGLHTLIGREGLRRSEDLMKLRSNGGEWFL